MTLNHFMQNYSSTLILHKPRQEARKIALARMAIIREWSDDLRQEYQEHSLFLPTFVSFRKGVLHDIVQQICRRHLTTPKIIN